MSSVSSLPHSNLDRLDRFVSKKEDGGRVNALPLKGPPQQPWRNPKPWNMPVRDDFHLPSPGIQVKRFEMGGVAHLGNKIGMNLGTGRKM